MDRIVDLGQDLVAVLGLEVELDLHHVHRLMEFDLDEDGFPIRQELRRGGFQIGPTQFYPSDRIAVADLEFPRAIVVCPLDIGSFDRVALWVFGEFFVESFPSRPAHDSCATIVRLRPRLQS